MPEGSPAPVEPFRLVSSNTFGDNPSASRAAATLLARHAGVLVTVETRVTLANSLARGYANAHAQRAGGLDVFSIFPLRPLPPLPGVPTGTLMRTEVLRPGAPFVLYAVHLANPLHEVSFTVHAETVGRLLAAAEREHLPVVLAGDFNMSDRTSSYRAFDGAFRDAMRASFARSTYDHGPWVLLQLRIDHVFTSRSICSESPSVFGVPGSDHDALEVELGACPS
jgi:endonuclease/exonuclease/phosphatase (EEP) superfamily protein YafD